MKTLIFTAALPLLACAARAQNDPPGKDAPAETVKKAHPAAWLGIAMAESDEKVVIGQVVPGSPAEKAGLKDGDRILRIGDTAIEGQMQRVLEKVGQQKPGDTIELRYLRGDKEETAKIELAERPAQLEGDFRGEFRREKENIEQTLKEKVKESGKGIEETRRKIEDVKDELKKEAGQLRLKYDKLKNLQMTPEGDKKKPAPDIELDPFKEADGGKLFRYYFDKEWRGEPGDDFKQLQRFQIPHPFQEAAIWKRVQESIARALKESNIGPDVSEKVMKAVEEARRAGSEKEARRTRLEAEAAKLEKEMQSLKERTDKVREELKKATE